MEIDDENKIIIGNNNNYDEKISNLFQKQINIQKENIEKKKIEEFKNLLEQIVKDCEK